MPGHGLLRSDRIWRALSAASGLPLHGVHYARTRIAFAVADARPRTVGYGLGAILPIAQRRSSLRCSTIRYVRGIPMLYLIC